MNNCFGQDAACLHNAGVASVDMSHSLATAPIEAMAGGRIVVVPLRQWWSRSWLRRAAICSQLEHIRLGVWEKDYYYRMPVLLLLLHLVRWLRVHSPCGMAKWATASAG